MSALSPDTFRRHTGPVGARRGAPIGAEWDPLIERALVPPPPSNADTFLTTRAIPTPRPIRPAPPPPARLALPPEPQAQRDVSPSRLAYRLNRLWLTPAVRRFVAHGLPALMILGALAAFWAGADRRAMVMGFAADLRAAVEDRPEFRISRVEVVTPTPEVAAAVLARLEVTLPASSLRLDLDALRGRAEALDAVARASLVARTTGSGEGVLEVRLTERAPAWVWRHADGLDLIDATGRRVARVAHRDVRADLPMLAGEGAPDAVAEAAVLLAAAQPIGPQVAGLVRMGMRRWDLVLDSGLRILLPATDPVAALERALALHAAQDLLARDIAAVDLRNPLQPTLRLTPEAALELARIRQTDTRTALR